MQLKVRAHHETCNARLKMWGCLSQTFHHERTKHGDVFRACAILTQLAIKNGELLYQVDYDDNPNI